LTPIAILVDKYQLHEVVQVFSSMWIEVLEQGDHKACGDRFRAFEVYFGGA